MQVSSEKVKNLILGVINQVNFPGSMAEEIASLKREIAEASIEERKVITSQEEA